MSTQQDYWFAHPLLGAHDTWAGFQLTLLAGSSAESALLQLAQSADLGNFDPRTPWFVPVLDGSPYPAPWQERAVTLFPDTAKGPGSESLASRDATLRSGKYKVGQIVSPTGKLPATGLWDYVQITASHARSLPPYTLLGMASRSSILGTELHSATDRTWLLNNACTLTTDEYLLARPTAGDRHADMTRFKLLKLLTLIEDDAHNEALETVFRDESKLAYSLLRLVNCAALAPRDPIVSFGQAINLLGRRQLRRWLQLLVYADSDNGLNPNPLLPKAAARGRLLEQLATTLALHDKAEGGDTAFMIGTFSLLDALLNMPMSDVLQQLPLNEEARKALIGHEGPLGALLKVIEAVDRRNYAAAAEQLSGLNISPAVFLSAQFDALAWAAKIPERT